MRVLLPRELVSSCGLRAVVPEQYTAPSCRSRINSKARSYNFNVFVLLAHSLDRIRWKIRNTTVPDQHSDKFCIDHAGGVEDVVVHNRRARLEPLCDTCEDCLELGLLPEVPVILNPAPVKEHEDGLWVVVRLAPAEPEQSISRRRIQYEVLPNGVQGVFRGVAQ